MPPMPTVIVRRSSGATPAVHRLSGGTSLGAALNGSFSQPEVNEPADARQVRMNGVVEFKGFLYSPTWNNGGGMEVFRRPVTGGAWAQVTSQAGTPNSSGTRFRSGLYVVNTGTGPTLAMVWRSNNDQVTLSKTTDGGSWSHSVLGTPLTGGVTFSEAGSAVYRGQLIFPIIGLGAAGSMHVDVAGASLVTVAGVVDVHGASICVFKNRLFMVVADGSHIGTLYELVGGTWQSRGGLPTSYVGGSPLGSTGSQGHNCILAIGDTKMVAVYLDATANNTNFHWKACDITVSGASFTFTSKNSLIPASLQLSGGAANKNLFGWSSFVDNETVPGTPAHYFWSWGPGSASAFVYYEYIDSDSELLGSTLGIQANQFDLVHGQGGGERINTSDADLLIDSISITQAPTPGRARITVVARGATGVADKFLRGYFNTLENPVLQQMQLVGSPTGGVAVRNGNQIEQVEADPANTYTFDWDSVAQGIFNNQPCRIQIQISTS